MALRESTRIFEPVAEIGGDYNDYVRMSDGRLAFAPRRRLRARTADGPARRHGEGWPLARRVCAEALSAGWWYYGEAASELVEKFFEKQVKDGLIIW